MPFADIWDMRENAIQVIIKVNDIHLNLIYNGRKLVKLTRGVQLEVSTLHGFMVHILLRDGLYMVINMIDAITFSM